MSRDMLEKTFDEWYRHYPYKEEDEIVSSYLSWPDQREGWLRRVRESQFLSTKTVAKRMNISANAYSRMERGEFGGNITLKKMRNMAEAMDCEVLYVIRPRKKIKFSQMVWQHIADALKRHKLFRAEDASVGRVRQLAFLARCMIEKPRFRRQHGWTARKGYSGFRDGAGLPD